ncbi:MAG: hypothetical protein M3Z57_03235, partial [Candidatus Dormibacteraeota bacterium]|nr:hypothetical protein [Candidatus Dormibacteraeota bacterium]
GTQELELARCQMLWNWMITAVVPQWLVAAERPDLAAAVIAHRGAGVEAAIVALDVYGHVPVRPINDNHISINVTSALDAAGVTAACVAGRDAADGLTGSRARRRWESARVVTRAAAWSAAEFRGVGTEQGDARLRRTGDILRESAFVVLEGLIDAGAPPPPPPPPPPNAVENGAIGSIWSPQPSREVVAGR